MIPKLSDVLKKNKILFVIHHIHKEHQKTMQINPKYKNELLDIYDFFEEKIKFLNLRYKTQ